MVHIFGGKYCRSNNAQHRSDGCEAAKWGRALFENYSIGAADDPHSSPDHPDNKNHSAEINKSLGFYKLTTTTNECVYKDEIGDNSI